MNAEQLRANSDWGGLPSWRDFLEGLGTGTAAFVLVFQLPTGGARAEELPERPGQFNAFLAIGEDDIVTAIIAQTEGGQGNSTGMTQVIAAELGAAWPHMRHRFTTERRAEYINPMLYEGLVLTAGSSSIPGFYNAMRHAAAATREMLVAAAARRLDARPEDFLVADSKVIHSPSSYHFSFGQLAADAAKSRFPRNPGCVRAANSI